MKWDEISKVIHVLRVCVCVHAIFFFFVEKLGLYSDNVVTTVLLMLPLLLPLMLLLNKCNARNDIFWILHTAHWIVKQSVYMWTRCGQTKKKTTTTTNITATKIVPSTKRWAHGEKRNIEKAVLVSCKQKTLAKSVSPHDEMMVSYHQIALGFFFTSLILSLTSSSSCVGIGWIFLSS